LTECNLNLDFFNYLNFISTNNIEGKQVNKKVKIMIMVLIVSIYMVILSFWPIGSIYAQSISPRISPTPSPTIPIPIIPSAKLMPHSVLKSTGFQSQLYWADPRQNMIIQSSLDGQQQQAVAKNLSEPYGLSLDQKNDLLICTSSGKEVALNQFCKCSG